MILVKAPFGTRQRNFLLHVKRTAASLFQTHFWIEERKRNDRTTNKFRLFIRTRYTPWSNLSYTANLAPPAMDRVVSWHSIRISQHSAMTIPRKDTRLQFATITNPFGCSRRWRPLSLDFWFRTKLPLSIHIVSWNGFSMACLPSTLSCTYRTKGMLIFIPFDVHWM